MSDDEKSLRSADGEDQRKQDPKLMLQLVEEDQHKLLMSEITNLKRLVTQKEDRLRKLKMVEIYSKKDDLCNLDELTAKWRHASQEIIIDLQNALPDPKPSIAELLRSYQIDFKLMKYDEDEECFS